MNFRKATDALLASVTLDDLATAMGISVQALRQARADEGSTAYRSPPPNWEKGVLSLAKRRARHFQALAREMGAKAPRAAKP